MFRFKRKKKRIRNKAEDGYKNNKRHPKKEKKKAHYDLMQPFYAFLDQYRLSEYKKDSKIVRKKSVYEEDVQKVMINTWAVLKTAKVRNQMKAYGRSAFSLLKWMVAF